MDAQKLHYLFLTYYRNLLYVNKGNRIAINRFYRTCKILESELDKRYFSEKEEVVRSFIYQTEDLLSNKHIIPTKPKYNPFLFKEDINPKDFTSILDFIANEARRMLLSAHCFNEPLDINKIPTAKNCYISSGNVRIICQELGLKCQIIKKSVLVI